MDFFLTLVAQAVLQMCRCSFIFASEKKDFIPQYPLIST